MGMFDEVTCHYPLKKCPAELLGVAEEWQTKDFGRNLDTYILTQEGRLLKRTYVGTWEKYPTPPMGIYWNENAGEYEDVDTKFHGTFRMYTHTKSTGRWIEYRIKFTNGQLAEAIKMDKRERG